MTKNANTIRQFAADNAPATVLKNVKVAASYVLVVPSQYFETVIKALVSKSVMYQTYARKNDMIIAILLKG